MAIIDKISWFKRKFVILIGISGTLLTSTIFIVSVGIFQATLDDVDHSLFSHLRSRHKVRDVIDCLQKCRDDLQCLSFNFQYITAVSPKNNCELNGVTKGQDPKNFVRRPGYTFYENVEWLGERCYLKWNWKEHPFHIYYWPLRNKIRAKLNESWTIHFNIRSRIYIRSHTIDNYWRNCNRMEPGNEVQGADRGWNISTLIDMFNHNKGCENKDTISQFTTVCWIPS